MKKKPEESHFKMSQAELVVTANQKLGFLSRDLKELAEYAVTEERLKNLQQLIADFVAVPSEGEGVQAIAATTLAKEKARRAALSTMQRIMGKVALVHNDRTPQYKAFGTSGLNTASDGDLYLGLVRCVRVGRTGLAAYAAKGLTAADLDLLEEQNAAMLKAIGQQDDAETNAAGVTQQRLKAGNALYKELSELCEIGKTAFVQTDVTRHGDYVLYEEPAAPA